VAGEKPSDHGRERWPRLRITFRAGNRAEQAAIINSLLRANLRFEEISIKACEDWIRTFETDIGKSDKRIKSSHDPQQIASLQEGIQHLRTQKIPACRDEIARRKQFVVIKWAN
jgi:hypothetical protein